MAKKLLALLLAMSMVFSMCAFNVFAEEAGDTSGETSEETTAATEETEEETDEETESETETEEETDEETESETESETEEETDEETESETESETEEPDEDPITIDIKSSYKQGSTVVVTGEINDDSINGVTVVIESEDDDVYEKEKLTVAEYTRTGYEYVLKDATAGVEYEVTVYDTDDKSVVAYETFVVMKSASSSSGNTDATGDGNVVIWIEGLQETYVEKTVVSLDDVDEATVLGVAEFLLEDVDRNYKLSADKSKIDRIATTATGSTYLRDNASSSKYLEDCQWNYFLNGRNHPESMAEMEVEEGDEIVLFYGEIGEVGYPIVEIDPDNGISLKDKIEVTVMRQITDPDTWEVESDYIKGAKVYFYKRNATTKTGGATNTNGVFTKTADASFIKTYQGGTMVVSYFSTSSSKPMNMVSKEFGKADGYYTERDGYVQAYITIEGAHHTLFKRQKASASDKIEEYDLLNYTMEVFDNEDVEYELNREDNNFVSIETNSKKGYSNENGDLTDDSGWYVSVNGEIYTPDDDLEDVEVFTDDEIVYYFGDENTVYAYHDIKDDLTTGKKVKVGFYYDPEFTQPIEDLIVYFDGSGKAKKYTTDEDGIITLASVSKKGTYELQWGEQVDTTDNYCPEAVYRVIELTYTGANQSDEEDDEDDDDDDRWTGGGSSGGSSGGSFGGGIDLDDWVEVGGKDDDDDDWNIFDDDDDKNEDDDYTSDWGTGDYDIPQYGDDDFVAGPSKYYPDMNIDAWAVDGVNKAYEYGLMKGTAKGYFEPLRGITRAEFTTIICRMLGLDTTASIYTQKFTDVTPSDWYYGSVMAAQAAGYVSGKSATSFAPSDYITREEIAVLVARIINAYGAEADVYKYADGASVSAWARTSVVGVNAAGIITGDQFGQFLPKENVNRQTAATIAVRLYGYLGLAQ